MGFRELEELRKRKKDQSVRLIEVSDLTKQMAEALDRKDQISVEMLLSMRETPIRQMAELEDGLRDYVMSLPQETAARCAELLNGAEAQDGDEALLCDEVAKYRRLLRSVLDLDKRVSLKLGGSQSFYQNFRE